MTFAHNKGIKFKWKLIIINYKQLEFKQRRKNEMNLMSRQFLYARMG